MTAQLKTTSPEPKKRLAGQDALVTGASRGIGAALAKALAAEGAHVIALARTQGGLEALDDVIQAAGGPPPTLLVMDLRKLDDVDKIGPSLFERFGRLDILALNAGMLGPLTPAAQITPKDFDKVMTLNVAANARLLRAADTLLRAAPAARVIGVSSSLVVNPQAYWGLYTASKAAFEALLQAYALETQQTAIKVHITRPGAVDTAMLKEAFPGGFQGVRQDPAVLADEIINMLLG